MAEQTVFLIVAAIIIIIVVAVAALSVFGSQLNPFSTWLGKGRVQSSLCQQFVTKGCINNYLSDVEIGNEKTKILYSEIGQRLPYPQDKNNDANRATFLEVCEYLGLTWDECLKSCHCKIPS
jgi:hypothetical protein